MSRSNALPALQIEYRLYSQTNDGPAAIVLVDIRPSVLSHWEVTIIDWDGKVRGVRDEVPLAEAGACAQQLAGEYLQRLEAQDHE